MNNPDLLSTFKAIGKGFVFVGDPFAAGGLKPLGMTEGEIKVAFAQEFNDLKFPEYTGPAVHDRRLTGENVTVTIPLILGDPLLFETLSPIKKGSGGYTSQQKVLTMSLLVIPQAEMSASGITYTPPTTGTTPTPGSWSPAAPKQAVWVWKGHFTRPGMNYKQADGGKVIAETTFQAMFSTDTRLPEGHKLYTIGDPVAAGVTGLVI